MKLEKINPSEKVIISKNIPHSKIVSTDMESGERKIIIEFFGETQAIESNNFIKRQITFYKNDDKLDPDKKAKMINKYTTKLKDKTELTRLKNEAKREQDKLITKGFNLQNQKA
tara:strand:- start:46 stop:387 length:342 start_codon:yes stop_codon:yes gene_type:complete